MKMTVIRNLLIVLGIYWLSMWLVVPIFAIFFKITGGIIYSGDLGALLLGFVGAIPIALVASGAGILSVYALEGRSRIYWLIGLALLYAVLRFLGIHWEHTPRVIDLVAELVRCIVPAIVCFFAGYITLNMSKLKTK